MSSPVDVMNMFGDGSMDVTTLFPGASDFNIGQHLADSHESLYGHMSMGSNLISTP
jgi:hypothetical protein